jgi:hypothetical protein
MMSHSHHAEIDAFTLRIHIRATRRDAVKLRQMIAEGVEDYLIRIGSRQTGRVAASVDKLERVKQ